MEGGYSIEEGVVVTKDTGEGMHVEVHGCADGDVLGGGSQLYRRGGGDQGPRG